MAGNIVDNAARGYANAQWASDNVHRTTTCKHANIGHCGSTYRCLNCGEKGITIQRIWEKELGYGRTS